MADQNAPTDTIGLCLSGGGFRASFLHLGLLRYLAEAGHLGNVSSLSTVSGGSIIGAHLAVKWDRLKQAGFSYDAFMGQVYGPFRERVTTRNFRNRWLLECLLTIPLLLVPGFTWIKLWGPLLDRWFYGGRGVKMRELPEGPDLVVNSTHLSTGKAYRFSREFRGDDDGGYRPYSAERPVRLADAVTSSAAQIHMRMKVAPGEAFWCYDGGAFDNTGLDWHLDWEDKPRPEDASHPRFVIASEASSELGPWKFGWRNIPLLRLVPMLKRLQSIQYEQTRRTRKDWFIDRLRGSSSDEGIIISIDAVARDLAEAGRRDDYDSLVRHTLPRAIVGRLRNVRTDLDNFLEAEADLLAYQGYWLAHVYLKTFHEGTQVGGREMAVGDPQWKIDLSPDALAAYEVQLKSSHKRFSLKRRLW